MGCSMSKIDRRGYIMIGIMFVGLLGDNATTVIVGSMAMKYGYIPLKYGITDYGKLFGKDFTDVHDMVFSGWDYQDKSVFECAMNKGIISTEIISLVPELNKIMPYKGIHTDMDIPLEDNFNHYYNPQTVTQAIQFIKKDILDFKSKNHLNNVIVFYMGSPAKVIESNILKLSYDNIMQLEVKQLPSSLLYAIAAIESNAHFVDFTPSETLEFCFINDLARKYGVQVSGRDGSTGQTMLKLVIADMLRIRNLHLDAWYSTNIIGNHDGYILSMPEYCVTKIQDKTNGIKNLLGYDDFEHKVSIEYFKYKGDKKESWDAVYFSGWLNEPMSLKLNWQGEDSILAAPIILDIIRLIVLGSEYGLCGIQKQLGLFYKHPFLCEGMSFTQLYEQLINYYAGLS